MQWTYLVAMCVAATAISGCSQSEPADSAGPLTWKSAKISEIYHSSIILPRPEGMDDKAAYDRFGDILTRNLRQQLSPEEFLQLVDSFAEMPPDDQVSPETRSIFEATIFACSDREVLARLLSIRCPQFVGLGILIEFHVANRSDLGEHPILILPEAYRRSSSTAARHELAVAMRRAFTLNGIKGNGDDDFVRNAEEWYRENVERLTVNNNYLEARHELMPCPPESLFLEEP